VSGLLLRRKINHHPRPRESADLANHELEGGGELDRLKAKGLAWQTRQNCLNELRVVLKGAKRNGSPLQSSRNPTASASRGSFTQPPRTR
jgi:hypothetical protein